jgi:DNA-binding GntR family transcriptional regulator
MAAAGNSALQSTYRSLSGRVQRARFSAHKTDDQWRRAIDDHSLMVMLLRRRDGAALAQLMRDHIKSKWPVISAAYSEAKQSKLAGGKQGRARPAETAER